MWKEKLYKRGVRELAVQNPGWTASTAIFMPGREMACIDAAMESGLVDYQTEILAIERDLATAGEIRRAMHERGLQALVSATPLHKTQMDIFPHKFDYAFFDLCGVLSKDILVWLYEQDQLFSDGAIVAATFNLKVRNAGVLKEFADPPSWVWDKMMKELDGNRVRMLSRDYKYRWATYAAFSACLGAKYWTKLLNYEEYCDGTPMAMMRFQVRPKKAAVASNKGTMPHYFRNTMREYVAKKLSPTDPVQWVFGTGKRGGVRRGRPVGMSPQQWAWHPMNPRGIRRNK